jgi:putative transposase
MAHTYSLNFLHCVFSTKGRLPLIADPPQVWRTLQVVARNAQVSVIAVGGTANHVHLLLELPKTRTLPDVMRELKANSSARLRRSTRVFAWQDGYGAISVSPTAIPAVTRYINEQERHHSSRSFEQEFTSILERAGVKYDPQYVFD